MVAMTIHVETRGLPAVLKTALEAAGYRRPTVRIERRETVSVGGGATFTGNRSFAVGVNLATGEVSEVIHGSWGGATPFAPASIDHDRREHPIPPNGAVITGETGGRGAFATIYVHPNNVTPALQAASVAMPLRDAAILAVYSGIRGGYRQDYLRGGNVSQTEIETLAKLGFLKINRAGAVQATADGKNAAEAGKRRAAALKIWGWIPSRPEDWSKIDAADDQETDNG